MDNMTTLLDRADQSGITAATKLAKRIRFQLETLAGLLERERELVDARQRIDKLKTQLAKEEAVLKRLTTAARKSPASTSTSEPAADVPNKTIRDWAAAQGLDCPPMGRVSRDIRLAYVAAHEGS